MLSIQPGQHKSDESAECSLLVGGLLTTVVERAFFSHSFQYGRVSLMAVPCRTRLGVVHAPGICLVLDELRLRKVPRRCRRPDGSSRLYLLGGQAMRPRL